MKINAIFDFFDLSKSSSMELNIVILFYSHFITFSFLKLYEGSDE